MLSHVGIANCFYCGEASQILLDTKLRKKLPMKCGVVNLEPCSKCAECYSCRLFIALYDALGLPHATWGK